MLFVGGVTWGCVGRALLLDLLGWIDFVDGVYVVYGELL